MKELKQERTKKEKNEKKKKERKNKELQVFLHEDFYVHPPVTDSVDLILIVQKQVPNAI